MLYHFVYDSLTFIFAHYDTGCSSQPQNLDSQPKDHHFRVRYFFYSQSYAVTFVFSAVPFYSWTPDWCRQVSTTGWHGSLGATAVAVFHTCYSSFSFPAVTQFQNPYYKHKYRCYLYIYLLQLPFIDSVCVLKWSRQVQSCLQECKEDELRRAKGFLQQECAAHCCLHKKICTSSFFLSVVLSFMSFINVKQVIYSSIPNKLFKVKLVSCSAYPLLSR